MLTVPPTADITTVPVRPPAVFAWMRPVFVTRLVMIPSAARAERTTVPPSAMIVPVLVTKAVAPPGAFVT